MARVADDVLLPYGLIAFVAYVAAHAGGVNVIGTVLIVALSLALFRATMLAVGRPTS